MAFSLVVKYLIGNPAGARGNRNMAIIRSLGEVPTSAMREMLEWDAVKEVAAGSSVKTGWTASFVDYVYFSLSNSMAFSPTDTMPLSRWRVGIARPRLQAGP
ncbi:MAG: hypothetical protein ACTHL6_14150 [Arthrobacter sp.]